MIGILMPIAGALIGIVVLSSSGETSPPAQNDFIANMLQSEVINEIVQNIKMNIAVGVFALSLCLGIITFGIGAIMARVERLGRM
jgi:hypothetical protein